MSVKNKPSAKRQQKRSIDITFWGTLSLMLGELSAKVSQFFTRLFNQLPLSLYQKHKLKQYALLMRLDKPIGTLLLLWPTLWALWLAAESVPDIKLIILFSIGVFLTRSAGCVINDYADRHIDSNVERTKKRPLAQGHVSEKEALLLFVFLGLAAFLLVFSFNTLTIILSVVAIIIATIYPFMKRITYFPQVVLGAAFSMAIPMAFAATQNEIPQTAWLLYICNLLWVLAYDTLYGMVDKKDDLKLGVKSTAILFGEADLQIIATIQTMFIFGMLLVGSKFELNSYYYGGVFVAAILIVRQLYKCRKRQTDQCFAAFINNNWVGVVIFCGILLSKSIN